MTEPRQFLKARWEYLVMFNHVVDPDVLKPYVPAGVELDVFQDRHYVSLVGFRFLDTRVMGCRIPFHVNFDEINLRFYVRRKVNGEWRRGVVFVKELVPRWAIATVARVIYHEPYDSLPMGHHIHQGDTLDVSYKVKAFGRWYEMAVAANPQAIPMGEGSEEEFITEHYWGYNAYAPGVTLEYGVEHPRWEHFPVQSHRCDFDFVRLYPETFAPYLEAPPASVFLARGSEVVVRRGLAIHR